MSSRNDLQLELLFCLIGETSRDTRVHGPRLRDAAGDGRVGDVCRGLCHGRRHLEDVDVEVGRDLSADVHRVAQQVEGTVHL